MPDVTQLQFKFNMYRHVFVNRRGDRKAAVKAIQHFHGMKQFTNGTPVQARLAFKQQNRGPFRNPANSRRCEWEKLYYWTTGLLDWSTLNYCNFRFIHEWVYCIYVNNTAGIHWSFMKGIGVFHIHFFRIYKDEPNLEQNVMIEGKTGSKIGVLIVFPPAKMSRLRHSKLQAFHFFHSTILIRK